METQTTTEKTMTCKHCGRTMPEDKFMRNAFGHYNVCKECHHKHSVATRNQPKVTDLKSLRLKDFTPRELIE